MLLRFIYYLDYSYVSFETSVHDTVYAGAGAQGSDNGGGKGSGYGHDGGPGAKTPSGEKPGD